MCSKEAVKCKRPSGRKYAVYAKGLKAQRRGASTGQTVQYISKRNKQLHSDVQENSVAYKDIMLRNWSNPGVYNAGQN